MTCTIPCGVWAACKRELVSCLGIISNLPAKLNPNWHATSLINFCRRLEGKLSHLTVLPMRTAEQFPPEDSLAWELNNWSNNFPGCSLLLSLLAVYCGFPHGVPLFDISTVLAFSRTCGSYQRTVGLSLEPWLRWLKGCRTGTWKERVEYSGLPK